MKNEWEKFLYCDNEKTMNELYELFRSFWSEEVAQKKIKKVEHLIKKLLVNPKTKNRLLFTDLVDYIFWYVFDSIPKDQDDLRKIRANQGTFIMRANKISRSELMLFLIRCQGNERYSIKNLMKVQDACNFVVELSSEIEGLSTVNSAETILRRYREYLKDVTITDDGLLLKLYSPEKVVIHHKPVTKYT